MASTNRSKQVLLIYLFLHYNLFATCSFSTMYSVIKDQDLEFKRSEPLFQPAAAYKSSVLS
mgnify:CR=1 FL=1